MTTQHAELSTTRTCLYYLQLIQESDKDVFYHSDISIVYYSPLMKTFTVSPKGIQWTLTHFFEDLDFADDVCLLSHSYHNAEAKLESLHTIAKSTGQGINVSKTKILQINGTQSMPTTIGDQPWMMLTILCTSAV